MAHPPSLTSLGQAWESRSAKTELAMSPSIKRPPIRSPQTGWTPTFRPGTFRTIRYRTPPSNLFARCS